MTTKEEDKSIEDKTSEPEILISEDLDKSSEIYMVCLDCEPMFYCLELKEARQEAERLAKKMTINYIGEKVHVDTSDEDTFVLVRQNRWFVVSYDEIVNIVNVVRLPRLKKKTN